MAVNRFLNPVFNKYESQYIPVQLPYENIIQQVQGKQAQQDAVRAGAIQMQLKPQGLNAVQTHFGPYDQYRVNDLSNAEAVINPLNQKLQELSTRAGDLTTGDVTAELLQLQKEYAKAKNVLDINSKRSEAYNKLLEEKAKAKATDHRGLFYQQQIDKMRADDTYIPGSTTYYDEVSRNKNVNTMLEHISPSTIQNWVRTAGDWITDFNSYGVTPEHIMNALNSSIEQDKALQQDIQTELDWKERMMREQGYNPDEIKVPVYSKDAKGNIIQKEVSWREAATQEIYNDLYSMGLKAAFQRYDTDIKANQFAVNKAQFDLTNPVAIGTTTGSGLTYTESATNLKNARLENNSVLNNADKNVSNFRGELRDLLINAAKEQGAPVNYMQMLDAAKNASKYISADGRVNFGLIQKDLGIAVPTEQQGQFESSFANLIQATNTYNDAKYQEEYFNAHEQAMAKKIMPIVSSDINLDGVTDLTGNQILPEASKTKFKSQIIESLSKGLTREEFQNSLGSIDQSQKRFLGAEYERLLNKVEDYSRRDKSFALTYEVADGGVFKPINDGLANVYKDKTLFDQAMVEGTGMDVKTYLTNSIGADAAETAQTKEVKIITTPGLSGKPLQQITFTYKDGDQEKQGTVTVQGDDMHSLSLKEYIARAVKDNKSNASSEYNSKETEMLGTTWGTINYGEQLRNAQIYSAPVNGAPVKLYSSTTNRSFYIQNVGNNRFQFTDRNGMPIILPNGQKPKLMEGINGVSKELGLIDIQSELK